MDDLGLVSATIAGDEAAFSALYEKYVRRIYDFTYYRVHHRETAEDIVSQTFMKAFEKLPDFDPERGAFSAWLHRIARNLVIDHYRSFHASSPIEDAWGLPSDADVVRDAEAALRMQRVKPALMKLEAHQREIVLLRLWQGLSFAEIGEIVSKSEDAAKMSFHRSLATLRDALLILILFLTSFF